MSTIITYNGSTITQVNNETKTLTTSGKWMEADIVITDVTQSSGIPAVSVVDTLDSHGGTVREITAIDISDTTAVASDVAQGKYFYTSLGIKTAGTASGGSGSSATAHTIYFEFSDNTNTTLTVYWDGTAFTDFIRTTTPKTYGGKTVTQAQLDGTAWYSVNNIPLNTELIDYTKTISDKALSGVDGTGYDEQWYYLSDYTPVDNSMTFSYTCGFWTYIGIYDNTKSFIRAINASSDSTVDPENGNVGHGTLDSSKLPLSASYVRLAGAGNNSENISLIRTA